MTGQPFTLLVDIPLKPGRADEFMALLNDVFEAMKVEETFVSATAYRNRYEARLPELLRSPRKLSFFEPIRSVP